MGYKVNIKVTPTIIVDFEAEYSTDIFKEISVLQELFGNLSCGCCKSADIKFLVRKDEEENEYFELLCNACRARLPFGQNKKKKGGLYPKKRWDSLSPGERTNRAEEEKYSLEHFGALPNGGWYKFKHKDKK